MRSNRKSESTRLVDRGFSIRNFQIFTVILVSVSGAYNAYQSSRAVMIAQQTYQQLQERDQETKRVQEFAKRIQEQLPNLTDASPAKAKIALASLYSLTQKESDKSILFTVSIVSDSKYLRETISDLILGDAEASTQFKQGIAAKLQKRLTAQSREAATQDQTDKTNQSKTEQTNKTNQSETDQTDKTNQFETEVKLLQQLTAERSTISGWIYLGKVSTGKTSLANEKTIKATTLPRIGTTIETNTAINLRDANGRRGNIIGVIARNSKLTVKELKRNPIDSDFEGVWAKVNR